MRVYFEVARRSFARQSTYRAATAAAAFTNTVFGFLIAYILLAVYAGKPEINGFTAADAVTFTFVSQGMVFFWGAGDLEQATRIGTGDVVIDLYRPIDYQGYWAAVGVGKAAFLLLARTVPPFVAGALWFEEVSLPPELWIWPAYLVSLTLAVALLTSFRFILESLAFWLIDVRGPFQLATVTAMFFAGVFVPTFLFPPGLLTLSNLLPFAGMTQWPIEVFLGAHRGAELAVILGVQLFWAVVLAVLARMIVARATRKVVIQGG